MADYQLSASEAPPFDILGLLLGGRGYASGWFQNRDKLRMLDAAQAKELADRQAYTKGVLASPELKGAVAAPYDRMAQFGLWGNMAAGPESMVPLANTLLTQSQGAIYGREQSILTNQLSAANIKLTADEQLRVDQVQRERDAAQKADLLKYLFSGDAEKGTPAQQQAKRDFAAQQLGFKTEPGYSMSERMDGQEPTIGGQVWQKMMDEGSAMSNLVNYAESLQNMATTGQGDKDMWATTKANMLLELKKAETLGALDEGTTQFFNQMVPDYYGDWGPDVSNKIADELSTNIKIWKNKLDQIGDKYRVPIDTFTGRKAFGNEKVPPRSDFGPVVTPPPSEGNPVSITPRG